MAGIIDVDADQTTFGVVIKDSPLVIALPFDWSPRERPVIRLRIPPHWFPRWAPLSTRGSIEIVGSDPGDCPIA